MRSLIEIPDYDPKKPLEGQIDEIIKEENSNLTTAEEFCAEGYVKIRAILMQKKNYDKNISEVAQADFRGMMQVRAHFRKRFRKLNITLLIFLVPLVISSIVALVSSSNSIVDLCLFIAGCCTLPILLVVAIYLDVKKQEKIRMREFSSYPLR